ncbi:hypothetical protein CU097_002422 [Rhizopus azygosporus]|uniref:Uncharacterized protein n=1 Tax=Rhizopus azygosporus TaxID=86630 RepID=A0A367IV56_RHIAZ|nr:hypothetical protein CU097_002422 [Rhizopus azygosporus]
MDNTSLKELCHTLQIIQNKISECNHEQRKVIKKITTKRALLQEAYQVLQSDLQNALLENKINVQKMPRPISIPDDLIPLLSNSMTEFTIAKNDLITTTATKIGLTTCRAWLRPSQRVWIQAEGIVLSSIDEAYLSCLPNSLLPETVYLNRHLTEDKAYFYCSFDLLPDIQPTEIMNALKIVCIYKFNDQYNQTDSYSVEWIQDVDDLGWTKMISFLPSMVPAYFPYCIAVKQKMSMDRLQDLTKFEKGIAIDKHYLLLSHQSCLIHLFNQDYLIIYGSSQSGIPQVARLFTGQCLLQNPPDEKDVILSLGDMMLP